MTTNNTMMFPNYNPQGLNIQEMNHEVIKKTGNEVFLILHDFESDNKISEFALRIKNKYQHILEDSRAFQEMDKYNLVDIFNELHDNLYYVGNNKGQLELIDKFNISGFDMLYKIIDTIGMTDSMHWKHIHMPVDKFGLLTQYIDHYQTKYFTQEDYLLMAQDLEYKNLAGLYSGINALNLAEGIHRIDIGYDDTVNILMFTHEYITKNLGGEDILKIRDLKIIYENYYDQKHTNIHKYSFSSVKRLLSMFGYKISDSQIGLKAA